MLAYPSDHQIKITVEPINGIHLSECEFDCYLFTYPSKKIVINKADWLDAWEKAHEQRMEDN